MGAMVVIALTTVAAFAAVDGDARESGKDVARKQALAAAEAGVNEYLYGLNSDNDYWAKCTGVPTPNAVNDVWNRVPPDPRKWAHGAGRLDAVHDRAAARQRLLEVHAGGQRRRLDDRRRQPHAAHPRHRPRAERQGPRDALGHRRAQARQLPGLPVVHRLRDQRPGLVLGALQRAPDRRPAGRPAHAGRPTTAPSTTARRGTAATRTGTASSPTTTRRIPAAWAATTSPSSPATSCSDRMHTNDELLACGTPTFGRNAQDRIESGNGWRSGGCSGVPNFQGTLIPDSSTIGMPATNASLATVAAAGGYTFTGSHDDQVRHRAGQDHRHQPADVQQHADGLPEQRRHLRQGQRLVPAVLRALPVVLLVERSTQRLGLRRREDQRHLRHRPDDRDRRTTSSSRATSCATRAGTPCSASSPTASCASSTTPTASRSPRRPTTPTCNNMAARRPDGSTQRS